MKEDWKYADKDLSKISISSNPNNEPVSIHGSSDRLNCIGIGTDAAVFQSIDNQHMHIKCMQMIKLRRFKSKDECMIY